jgi:hypothetical protein
LDEAIFRPTPSSLAPGKQPPWLAQSPDAEAENHEEDFSQFLVIYPLLLLRALGSTDAIGLRIVRLVSNL